MLQSHAHQLPDIPLGLFRALVHVVIVFLLVPSVPREGAAKDSTRVPVQVLPQHRGAVQAIAFADQDRVLVSVGDDQRVCLYELCDRRVDPQEVTRRAHLLQALDSDTFDARQAAYEELDEMGSELVEQLEVALASAESRETRARIVRLLQDRDNEEERHHDKGVRGVVAAQRGAQTVTAGRDNTIRFWNGVNGRLLYAIRAHDNGIWCVAMSPDDQRVATGGGDHRVCLWDVKTRRELIVFRGHDNTVQDVTFAPNGALVASAGGFDKTVCVWDAYSGFERSRWVMPHEATLCLDFHPQQTVLAIGGYGPHVFLRAPESGETTTEAAVSTPETSEPNGRQSPTAVSPPEMWTTGLAVVRSIRFSPDGRWVILGGKSSSAEVRAYPSGAVIAQLPGHADTVYDVQISASGTQVATADSHGIVRVWNVDWTAD
ncbi:MAG: hypothetical protein KDA60_02965 [Planctomycetales bacterium]|nr:hypothetical protein [Planctomycetales bacterium]